MPAIWNVGSINQTNEKKLSSKLTFEVGESFKGRIVSESDGNEVVVKLNDGWQFSAEVTGDNAPRDGKVVQFEVEGFENGKLKLKIVEGEQGKENTYSKDIVGEFLSKEGMSKSDADILKAMIKHNIPLTKENISFVKSIITFSAKVSNNPQEIDEFINKFIAGKGIDSTSEEAQGIKVKLKDFFNSFKTMGEKDILLFLENDIEFTKENIDSYNKIFKESGNLKEYFDNVSKELKSLDLPKVKEVELNENTNPKLIQTDNEKTALTKNAALKIYDSNVPAKEKLSMLSLIKSINGNNMEIIKDSLKDIIKENKAGFNSSEIKNMFVKLETMTDDDILKNIKKFMNNGSFTKNTIDKAIFSILGKEVNLSENSSEKIIDIINLKLNEEVSLPKDGDVMSVNVTSSTSDNINNSTVINENSSDNVNTTIREGIDKESFIKQGVDSSKTKSDTLIGNKANEEGVVQNKESANLNIVDKKNIVSKEIVNDNINISLKSAQSDIIKNDINQKIENIKDIIKDIMARTSVKGEGMEKVMDFIKNNISDFKMLNSVSNEYYYLDVPVNKQGTEYPCKLIIKDNRKDNKKIDRTNVKVVVAVKTSNIGTVDGYLTINSNNLTVALKCDEQFVKPIDLSKEKLIKPLQDIGFLVNISVSKRIEEVNLASCREFFDNSNQSAIDIKV